MQWFGKIGAHREPMGREAASASMQAAEIALRFLLCLSSRFPCTRCARAIRRLDAAQT